MSNKTKNIIWLTIQAVMLICMMLAMVVEDIAVEIMCGVLYLGFMIKQFFYNLDR